VAETNNNKEDLNGLRRKTSAGGASHVLHVLSYVVESS